VLSLNEYRIDEKSEDPESLRDFRIIFGRVSDVKESVSEPGFERADALRIMVFSQRSLTQSSRHAESRGLLSLFSNPCWRHGFVMIRPGCSGFGRSRAGFWTVLGNVSRGATKEAKFVVKMALSLLGLSFLSFLSFEARSGVVDFFCSEVEPLPWVEPE